ncbi:MAG: Recombination protein RecR [Chlamydiae bacterium]|nr:Recombination protein RecR [Chlamydiota bacterium]
MKYPDPLLKLIDVFRKLPGVGRKSAERFAFHLLEWPEEKLTEMAQALLDSKKFLTHCSICGSLIEKKCPFCDPKLRNQEVICLVASPKDVFLIEETREYSGLYFVLGGLFSPLHGSHPSPERLEKLKTYLGEWGTKEIVLAFDSTLEGDATALYLKKELTHLRISISRLALGLPMGSALDYIDGGTLARALTGRHTY